MSHRDSNYWFINYRSLRKRAGAALADCESPTVTGIFPPDAVPRMTRDVPPPFQVHGQRAIERGLSAAQWYRTPVARPRMKELMHRRNGPAIRDTIAQCRAHAATPILLLSAESSEFRSWYGIAGNARLSAWLTAFARECGVRLIDAREWLPDAHFADGHHPTAAGAEAFTARIAEELRR